MYITIPTIIPELPTHELAPVASPPTADEKTDQAFRHLLNQTEK